MINLQFATIRLIKSRTLHSLVPEDLTICESCLESKMTKRPFIAKGFRAKEWLELVHINMSKSFNIHAHGGYKYIITFTNDVSRYGYVYLIYKKSNALEHCTHWFQKIF